jgi:hypothetical protein
MWCDTFGLWRRSDSYNGNDILFDSALLGRYRGRWHMMADKDAVFDE